MFATVLVLPWRRYQFYMTAINDIGESDLSEPASQSQCVTPATAPSRNPNGVCSSLRAAKQLVIVWEVSRTYITLYLIPSTIGLLDEPTLLQHLWRQAFCSCRSEAVEQPST